MTCRRLSLVGLLILPTLGPTAGCSRPPAPVPEASSWVRIAESELSEVQKRQRDAAVAAREELFNRLMKRLGEVLQTQGAASAVAVCQAEAPEIARAVAQERNVRIGRTSDRLRNPNNRPPEWAADLIPTRPENPTYLAGADGRLAALLPIRLKPQCLTCHGPAERIDPAVRQALAEHYPQDRAVGYAENDLRGWFWVEVPAPQS